MKTIFIGVDLQSDFCNKGGKLYVEGAEEIIPNLIALRDCAVDHGAQMLLTGDLHAPSSTELSNNPDYKKTFLPHCLVGSYGMEFINELNCAEGMTEFYTWQDEERIDLNLAKMKDDIVIYKDQFDVFADNTVTERILKKIDPKEVIVFGVVTSVCVNFAVMGLLKRGYNVTVVTDAIKDLPYSNFDMSSWEVNDNKANLAKTVEIVRL